MGNNRYEIKNILKEKNSILAIGATSIYKIFKKHGLNKFNSTQKQARHKIIMSKIGELVHIDCHQLSKGITIAEPDTTYYLLGLIDEYSRIAWVKILENKKAQDVMFAPLKAFNILKKHYGIEIDTIMSDNGSEFGSDISSKNKESISLNVYYWK